MSTHEETTTEAFRVLMDSIYYICVLIIALNPIQTKSNKNTIFSAFCSFFYETYPHSSVNKKQNALS